MAVTVVLFVIAYCSTFEVAAGDGTVSVKCPRVIHGTIGEETVIRCPVKAPSDVRLKDLNWKAPDSRVYILGHSSVDQGKGGRFEVGWDKDKMEVWLGMSNTQMADEGDYKCFVRTDSGYVGDDEGCGVNLKVTARYTVPTIWSVPQKNLEEDMTVTMYCMAEKGYPRGTIHWFDQYGTNWTSSAIMTVEQTTGRWFKLMSTFTVLRASSSSSFYRCKVIGGNGQEEGTAELSLMFREPAKSTQKWSNNSIAAIVVVTGSVSTGILLLLLLKRRRPRYDEVHEAVPEHGEENEKDDAEREMRDEMKENEGGTACMENATGM
ncbi:hypothetical protein JZ751_013286 [Albula glossodonta]|uniref:Ig-like domain-containing protein n=1 Tax=Albula glossodonta TaxID=121402 RepID=A0A8T2NUL3_9TELE|nr:hypothetical protein JZ751_013286 [Albula glossodonta]